MKPALIKTHPIKPESWNDLPLGNELKLNIKIPKHQNANDLLQYLISKGEVTHFVEQIPSANDIFIQTVNGK